MNKTLKLVSIKIFTSTLEISWAFRQIMLVIKVCMLHVQRFKYLIRQNSFKFLFERTSHEA